MDANNQTEGVLKDALIEALSEIEDNMKAKIVPKPDEHIEHIIEKCDTVFQCLQNRLTELYSEAYIERSNESVDLDDVSNEYHYFFDPEELKQVFDKRSYDKKCERISYIFPCFQSRDPCAPISKILRLENDESKIAPVLPYLLTAYYLNLFGTQRIRASISSELSKKPGKEISRITLPSRDVCASKKMFSYDSFLPNFYAAGREVAGNKDEKVKNRSDFVRYLFTDREMSTQICNVQAYKVFIYSVITVACIEELSETNYHIDYERSWALFDAHTCPLATVLSMYYKTGKREQQESLMDEPSTMQSIFKRAFGPAANALLESRGVDMSDVIGALNEVAVFKMRENKGNSVQACNISFPSQQRVEHLSEYESLAYALRLLCRPFLQSGCDYPNIEDDLLEKTRKDNKNDVLNWRTKSEIKDPPHMPYVVIHARAKRSKTSGNKS